MMQVTGRPPHGHEAPFYMSSSPEVGSPGLCSGAEVPSRTQAHPVAALPPLAVSCPFSSVTWCLLGTAGAQVLTAGSESRKRWGGGCTEPPLGLHIREGTAVPKAPEVAIIGTARWAGRASPQIKSGLAPLLRKEGMEQAGD